MGSFFGHPVFSIVFFVSYYQDGTNYTTKEDGYLRKVLQESLLLDNFQATVYFLAYRLLNLIFYLTHAQIPNLLFDACSDSLNGS